MTHPTIFQRLGVGVEATTGTVATVIAYLPTAPVFPSIERAKAPSSDIGESGLPAQGLLEGRVASGLSFDQPFFTATPRAGGGAAINAIQHAVLVASGWARADGATDDQVIYAPALASTTSPPATATIVWLSGRDRLRGVAGRCTFGLAYGRGATGGVARMTWEAMVRLESQWTADTALPDHTDVGIQPIAARGGSVTLEAVAADGTTWSAVSLATLRLASVEFAAGVQMVQPEAVGEADGVGDPVITGQQPTLTLGWYLQDSATPLDPLANADVLYRATIVMPVAGVTGAQATLRVGPLQFGATPRSDSNGIALQSLEGMVVSAPGVADQTRLTIDGPTP